MPVPTDPLLVFQWHLDQTAADRFDLNVLRASNTNYTGAGVDVFVIDDAFDYTHSDISPNSMVAGVIALILDANPNLGWRDVQDILAASARQVGSAVGAGIAGFKREGADFSRD